MCYISRLVIVRTFKVARLKRMKYIYPYSSTFKFLVFPLIISAFFLCSLELNHCHAQITLDGSMGASGPLAGPDFNITSDLGKVSGSNLFHSFGEFNIQAGERATFSGPNSIANILSRVTGGNQSFINGILASTIPEANLYLLNPAGVLFGAGASLDVQGSFHVSTADYLRFSDGVEFHADLSKGSTLTVAEPAAFGFLGNNPASITIDQGLLNVHEGETLSVIGGDINIMGGILVAPGGRVNIASVASHGEVVSNVSGDTPDLQIDSFSDLGDVNLSQGAHIYAAGKGGGTVIIRGGRFVMNNSSINASTVGPAVGSLVGELGAGVDIQVAEDVMLDNRSKIKTNVLSGVLAGIGSGGVHVKANSLEVANSSEISSFVIMKTKSTEDKVGDIDVDANKVLIRDRGLVQTNTMLFVYSGDISSGDINVDAGSLEVRDGAMIKTKAFFEGNAGDIVLNSDSILLSNINVGGNLTAITSETHILSTGTAGDVTVTSGSLKILGGGNTEISSVTKGFGDGGKVKLDIDKDFFMSGSIENLTGIFANTFAHGNGGGIELYAKNINITTSSLQSRTASFGGTGNIKIITGSLALVDGGALYADGIFGLGGAGGNIEVTADSISVSGFENHSDPFGQGFTGIFTVTAENKASAGSVTLTTDNLIMTQRGQIASYSEGSGNGGNVEITEKNRGSGSVQLLDGSQVVANAFGSGDAGSIIVDVDSLLVSGVNRDPHLNTTINELVLTRSSLSSQTTGSGKAGDIIIKNAGMVKVLDGGLISSSTFGIKRGGNIEIHADNLLVSGENLAMKEFLGPTNKVGALSSISASSNSNFFPGATGAAGNINIKSVNLQLQDKGRVSTSTTTPGVGGDIELKADRIALSGGASIAATSTLSPVAGNAGNISITANNTFKSENSSVTTEAEKASGGNIKVTAGHLTHLVNSEITSSVGGGPDTVGGNITMNQPYGVLDNSKIIANAFEGRGGNIQITADVFIADPNSVVSASSAKGVDGEVDIRATVKNISANIGPLKEDYSSANSLLFKPCAVRLSNGKQSSLVVAGRDGLPARPGDLLPSPLYDTNMAKADAEVAGVLDMPQLAYGINFFEDKGLLPLDMMEADTGCATCPE